MLFQRVICYHTRMNSRFISQTIKMCESKPADNKQSSSTNGPASSANVSGSVIGPRMYSPSNFDKWLLVWIKRYPKGQVPDQIKEEVIYQSRNKARVKTANYMILFSITVCLLAVYSGKQAAKSGDSIQKRGEAWHKKINEEYAKEQAKAAEKS